MFLFRHRIILIYNDMQWQNFLYPHKVFFSFFLAEASSSDAGCHIGYVILVYLRQYPCKKSAPSVPSPRWTGPIIRVKSRCHLCETAASHRWSNKAIRLFHGNILPARYICWSFAAMGMVGAMWYIDRRLPTVSGPLQIFSHRNILIMKTMRWRGILYFTLN